VGIFCPKKQIRQLNGGLFDVQGSISISPHPSQLCCVGIMPYIPYDVAEQTDKTTQHT
jgi:hypothetical protein